MGYLNKTCSASGPVLRAASEGNTWTQFTITNLGKSAQNEDLVEIKTYYPINSSQKPRYGFNIILISYRICDF